MNIENLKKEGKSSVGDVVINYVINCDDQGKAKDAFAHIYKDGKLIGSANASNVTGAFGISFPNDNSLSWDVKKAVSDKIFSDLADGFVV